MAWSSVQDVGLAPNVTPALSAIQRATSNAPPVACGECAALRAALAKSGRNITGVAAARDTAVEGFRRALDPLRLTLKTQDFLGGAAPNYADYIVFGGFQWARVVSPFRLLAESDPVYAWREKLLDAFDGMARKSPGYPV